jgi:hypothetical protein
MSCARPAEDVPYAPRLDAAAPTESAAEGPLDATAAAIADAASTDAEKAARPTTVLCIERLPEADRRKCSALERPLSGPRFALVLAVPTHVVLHGVERAQQRGALE